MKPAIHLLITSYFLLAACHGPSAGSNITGATPPATAESAPSSGSELFSATIDGQAYSSSVSSGEVNLAVNQVDDAGNAYLVIMLGDVHSTDDPKITRTFRLVVAKKTGSVHLTQAVEIPDYGIDFDYLDGNFSKYRADDVQLSVASVSGTRVQGNFSGRMYVVDNLPGKKTLMVTVHFDVPIAR